jgi:hypothetical protein
MPAIDGDATGDIAIAILRRKGDIAVPVYLWTGGQWVDFAVIPAAQFSAWVDLRPTLFPSGDFSKTDNLTISRTNDW